MSRPTSTMRFFLVCGLSWISLILSGCGGLGGGSSSNTSSGTSFQLTVQTAGAGSGSVSSNPAGINCGQLCSASFASGTAVTLTATAAEGSTFVGWAGGCTGTTANCTVTLNASAQVTATFDYVQAPPVLNVALAGTGTGTVTSNPAGISCAPTCSKSFPAGTLVTLTETPATNSTFAGWSGGGCSGTASTCTVTLSTSQ